jgi:hypothetical protein
MATRQFTRSASVSEAGVANYMRQVFNYMTGGVALSGLIAWLAVKNPAMMNIALQGQWIFLIVWFGFGFFMQRIIFSLQPAAGLGVFAAFSVLTGFSLSPLMLVYTGGEIATAFFTAAFMFAGASLYGYVTNKSLSGWGNFLMMGAWGLIGAIVVNLLVSLFTGSPIPMLSFVISLVAVPLFAGMTAWETNQLKENYASMGGDSVLASRVAILGATSLYMNFIVMFIHILNLLGMARNN